MTNDSYIFRIAKLKGNGKVLAAAKHNKREIQAELGANSNINAERSHLNYSLTCNSNAGEIASKAKALMIDAGYQKLRKDAVLGIEIIFSLPPAMHNKNMQPFFIDCIGWVQNHFGGIVLSFDVHLDEAMPHAHALILPMANERMQGSDMVGNKTRLKSLQDDFYEHVASLHGLAKPIRKLSGNQKVKVEQDVLNYLKTDSVMTSKIWPCVRDDIKNHPEGYATLIGITTPLAKQKKEKDFVSIFISKGKGKQSNAVGLKG